MSIDVTIVLFRSRALVSRTLKSLSAQSMTPRAVHLLVSAGTDDLLDPDLLSHLSSKFTVNVFRRPDNIGFAEGHGFLAQKAFDSGAENVLILNPDVILAESALLSLWRNVEVFGAEFSLHAPLLLGAARDAMPEGAPVSSQTLTVDSAGIVWTRDGRHFDLDQGRVPPAFDGSHRQVAGVSGAVVLLTRDTYLQLLDRTGRLFDPLFVAYREDAELGVRVTSLGGKCYVHLVEGFIHLRGSTNAVRGTELQRLLGARNRFLLRWTLGSRRPGGAVRANLRDVMVLLAVFTIERTSLPGVLEAFRLRRTLRRRGKLLA